MKHCDFLVIGGGSAGCVVARRLADAGIGAVTLLEAGMSDEDTPELLDLSLLDQQTEETDWGFSAIPVRGNPRKIRYDRARMLGGCGNHNDCAFLEPLVGDLDRWAKLGAQGWSAREMRASLDRIIDNVKIDSSPPVTSLSETFVHAGHNFGLPIRDFRTSTGPGVGSFPLNIRGAMRQAASQAYLHPLRSLPESLEVLCNTRSHRLLVEGNRVVGCETSLGEIIARREVVVCCGSVQTPQLLMLSGIGAGPHLEELGISIQQDIPGIGQNLVDHVAANVCLELEIPVPTWELTPCEVVMMSNVAHSVGDPELLFHFVLQLREKNLAGSEQFHNLRGIKISPNVTRPRSRGELRLSSPELSDPPIIDLNYFSDPDGIDMKTMLEGLKQARAIAESPEFAAITRQEIYPGVEKQSKDDLVQYILETCETVYHPAGTCKMGAAGDPMAVVDPQLKLKNFANIRIADASVFPDMVSVNINNSVMMVAEKAADLIIRDWQVR